MQSRRMKYWKSDYVTQRTGWRRLGTIPESVLGQALDREEQALVTAYKPRIRDYDGR